MDDDWRLQVGLGNSEHVNVLSAWLDAETLRHDLSRRFQDRVIVTVDGSQMFVYAGSRVQAEKARDAITAEARTRGWQLVIKFRRWHPIAEEWMDVDLAVPKDEVGRRCERERLMRREREETASRGYPDFEVRADLHSRQDAMRLADRLRGEGLPAVHRWRYLLVGAADEDSAGQLAERILDEAPNGAKVKVEGTWAAAGRASPFAVLGTALPWHEASPREVKE